MGGRKSARGEKEARSQEPGAKGPGEGTPPPSPQQRKLLLYKADNLHGKDEQVQGTGATAGTRAWAKLGPTQSNPFR